MRVDRRKQDHHWFNILVVADRVKVNIKSVLLFFFFGGGGGVDLVGLIPHVTFVLASATVAGSKSVFETVFHYFK